MNTEHQFHPVTERVELALNELRDNIHDWAKKKGWWEKPKWRQTLESMLDRGQLPHIAEALEELARQPIRNKLELVALMHSELGEATEFLRKPGPDDHVPELSGEEAEMADTIIRIMDYCGAHGIDIGRAVAVKQSFNIKRPYRHGNKLA